MKTAEILKRSAEYRRDLMDHFQLATNGSPTPRQIVLVEFASTLHQEVAVMVARFCQLCDELTADGSADDVQDEPVDLEGGRKLLEIGGLLRCSFCHAEQSLSPVTLEQAATYMTLGFPRCCGFQMSWIPGSEIGLEQKQ